MTDSESKIPDEELEEGELSSDEEGGGGRQPEAPAPVFHPPPAAAAPPPSIQSPVKDKQPDFQGAPPEEGEEEDRKYNRRRRKKEHKKRKRESRDKKKASRPGAPKYVDHDQISEEFTGYQPGDWPGAGNFPQRSPPGPYDSPAGSNSAEEYNNEAWPRRKHGDKFNNRPAPGPYDSPYDSPPGVYDSPSDADEYGPPHKMKRNDDGNMGKQQQQQQQQHRSMMSMVDEEYMDANVAANEREEMFDRRKKNPPTASKLRKMEKSRHFREQQSQMRRELTKGEKKALKSMAEQQRPPCRFYMEGKCNKGYDCPFNHGFDPPKKFEVCKFYISDSCTKGRDCLYVHSEFPCRFHHKHGYCERGDNCKFSHTDLNDQTRDWLMQSAGFIAREEERLENEGMIPPLQKLMSRPQDEDLRPHKKPLLSTPPHIPEMHQMNMDHMDHMDHNMGHPRDMKKIPSLFEIQTFAPPGGFPPGPPGPMNSGPPGPGPSGPGPFYDGNGPPPRPPGPGLLGPGPPNGPLLPGPHPQGGPGGPGMMGPPMNGPQGYYDNYYMDGSNGNQPQDQNPDNEFSPQHGGPNGSGPPPNVPFDINHLPQKQRELFMRVQQQQHNNLPNPGNHDPKDDDNWYSDEDEDGEKKASMNAQNVANLLQSMHQQQSGGGPVTSSAPMGMPGQATPPVNIATMLSAIRNSIGGSTPNQPPGLLSSPQDPRSRPADPRKARSEKPELEIKCYGFKVKYALKRITVDGRPSLPNHIIKHDPKFKDDPRVDKYYQPNITSLPPPSSRSMSEHKKKSDPRLRRPSKEPEPQPALAMGLPLPPLQRSISIPSSPISTKYKPPTLSETPAMPADLLSPPADLKIQKTLPLPFEPEQPEKSPSWTKPRESRSNSESSDGDKRLDYRNDPRFRKKKSLSSDEAPKDDEGEEPSHQEPMYKSRRDQVDFESPLAAQDENDPKESMYSGYNRPPNENFHKAILSGSKSDPRNNSRGRGLSPNVSEPSDMASSIILPEQMEVPPSLPMEEPSLKDMFKTIDPTASPFC